MEMLPSDLRDIARPRIAPSFHLCRKGTWQQSVYFSMSRWTVPGEGRGSGERGHRSPKRIRHNLTAHQDILPIKVNSVLKGQIRLMSAGGFACTIPKSVSLNVKGKRRRRLGWCILRRYIKLKQENIKSFLDLSVVLDNLQHVHAKNFATQIYLT